MVTPAGSGSGKKRTRHQTSSDQKLKSSTDTKQGTIGDEENIGATAFDEGDAEGAENLNRKRQKTDDQNEIG